MKSYNRALWGVLVLVILDSLMFLAQIWDLQISRDLFSKVIATSVIIAIVLLAYYGIARCIDEEHRNDKDVL